MLIESMTRQASLALLDRTRLARLGCAHDGQPYIVPMTFAHDADCLYSFATLGQAISWMRVNPKVCVEVDELVTIEKWETVIVLGRFEELPNTPAYDVERTHAHALLQRRPAWWEPGYVRTIVEGKERPLEIVYFRIHIGQVHGRRGIPG